MWTGPVRDEANGVQVTLSRLRGVRKIALLEFDRHDEATTVLNTNSSTGAEVDSFALQELPDNNGDDKVTEAAPTKVRRCQRIFGALIQSDDTGHVEYVIASSSVTSHFNGEQPITSRRLSS